MQTREPTLEIRLLGATRALRRGRAVPLGGSRQRAILAVLLLHPGRTILKERLIEQAWPADPPATAGDLVVAYLSRLRAALDADEARIALLATRPGFRAEFDPEIVDVHRFHNLLRRARREHEAREDAEAIGHLQAALDAWHGESTAFADLDTPYLRSRAAALEARRLETVEELSALHLETGHPGRAVTLLQDLAPAHPEREGLTVTLVDALAATGEAVRAAQVAADCAGKLISLGQQPGAELRRAHTAALTRRSAGTEGSPPTANTPRHQLPADTRAFTGRAHEVAELERALSPAPGAGPAAAVCAVDGMAGVGKSALAVHVAHRLAARFPDGQLFVDLHGYTEGLPPRTAQEALELLLRALGVPPGRVPRDPGERAAAYRDRLAGTRTLILLDNAESEAQVVPLLPASPGSLVLVAGRRRLKALDDAYCLSLQPLHPADAHTLFRVSAGEGRAVDGPAVEEIVALCGQLPLAVRIAAALLRHRPAWSAGRLAELLRDEDHRVSALSDGKRDLEAVFNLSYGGLNPAQQQAFRRLGLPPGPEIDGSAAAALLDADPRASVRLLEDLVDHNLLGQPGPGRYQLHDLIRIHARARAAEDPAEERDAALDRLLGYQLATARSADVHLARRTAPYPAVIDAPPRYQPSFTTRDAAASWVRAELPNLLAGVDLAVRTGRRRHVAGMSAALHGYLYVEGPWTSALALHAGAVEAAEQEGDRFGAATALHALGRARRMLGDYPAAAAAHRRALELYRELDHRLGRANALDSLGRVAWLTSDYPHASAYFEQALELYREVDDLLGQAGALNGLGRIRWLTGGYAAAFEAHREALDLCRKAGDPIGQATAFNDLGRVLARVGDLVGGADAQESALGLYRGAGHRVGIARALNELGRIHRMRGEYDAAVPAHRRALTLYREMVHRSGQAAALNELGRTLHHADDDSAAAEALEAAAKLYREVGDLQGEAEALNGRGAVLTATGAPLEARVLHATALARARAIAAPFDEAEALVGMAESHIAAGDRATGMSLLRQAAELYDRLGVPESALVANRLAALEGH